MALADAGRWEEALKKFQAVVTIRSAPAALVALATAQEKTGKMASARRTYEKAVHDARTTGDQDIGQKAADARAALEERVARVVIRLPDEVGSANVSIDGTTAQATAQGIELDPGRHRLVVSADGRQPFEEQFEVAVSQRKEIVVRFAPASTTQTPPREPGAVALEDRNAKGDSSGGLPIGPMVLGGVGLAATVVGIVVRLNGQADYDDASSACINDKCASKDDVERGNGARDRMLTGTIVAGVGIGAVAGAGIWWALPSSSTNEQARRPTAPSTTSFGVGTLRGGAWLAARGMF